MAILNAVKREIVAKIVFYGPGLSGKTANIQAIHANMDPTNVGDLTSLATESDRTLFFDFVPINLGTIAGLNTRFQLFTVPGQVFYNQTRRTVLENTDGVVFVADSQPEQLENNLESLQNLEENLAHYGKKLTDVPFVLQFNKQDIPGVMTEEELNKVLNKYGAPSLRASCIEGYGVMETLARVSTMVLAHLREQMTKKGGATKAAPALKRTYSKEGVSDEQVVSNMLSNIAAAGGAAEAQAAAGIAPAAPAAPPRPPTPAAPIRPAAAPAPVRPAARPAPIAPAARPAGSAPKAAPGPIVPQAAPVSASSLSPEDLLSDLESSSPGPAAAPPRPAAAPASTRPTAPPPVAPAARPSPVTAKTPPPRPAAPPPPPPAARVAAPAPIPGPPSLGGTASGLRAAPAPSSTATATARTAEELLESMEEEERSGSGSGLVQESRGSFGTGGGLWQEDGPSGSGAASKLDGNSLFDIDGDEDVGNRTSVLGGNGGASPAPLRAAPEAAPEEAEFENRTSVGPAPNLAPEGRLAESPRTGESGPMRVVSVGQAKPAGPGLVTLQVVLGDGEQQVPVTLSISSDALKPGAAANGGGKGLAVFALLLSLLNLAAVGGLAVMLFGNR